MVYLAQVCSGSISTETRLMTNSSNTDRQRYRSERDPPPFHVQFEKLIMSTRVSVIFGDKIGAWVRL